MLQTLLFAVALAVLFMPLWPDKPMAQIWIAFAIAVFALLVGWFGAFWVRAARNPVPPSQEIAIARRRLMRRSRILFSATCGVIGAILAPFIPELSSYSIWALVPVGAITGAVIGVVLGQVMATQFWNTFVPKVSP
jgi:hypothetical protein